MLKPATLSAGLVARKGEAKPSVDALSDEMPAKPLKAAQAARAEYYKALTLKLDRERYVALKNAGVELDKSGQDILVEALDDYLEKIS